MSAPACLLQLFMKGARALLVMAFLEGSLTRVLLANAASLVPDVLDSISYIAGQPGVPKFIEEHNKSGRRLIIDAGYNDGLDSLHFMLRGFSVVGVDAHPDMIDAGRKSYGEYIQEGKLLILHAGVTDNMTGDLTFWKNTKHDVLSSFEKDKACQNIEANPNCEPVKVPLIRCEALWAMFGRPWFLKVDIEERHYTCINALRVVPRKLLPIYVSWEMHEFAKGKRYPKLDTSLMLMLSDLGYREMKIVLQNGHTVSDVNSGIPDDQLNFVTNDTSWSNLSWVLQNGVPNPRTFVNATGDLYYPWFDFYMKLPMPGGAELLT